MPHFIGEFISDNVYDGRLHTTHPIASKLACRFVDVQYGRQEHPNEGTSWIVSALSISVLLIYCSGTFVEFGRSLGSGSCGEEVQD